MATAGPALTCNGYNAATGKCASTSIPSSVPLSQYDSYMAGQGSDSSFFPSDSVYGNSAQLDMYSTKDYIGAAIDGLIHPFDTLTGNRTANDAVNTGQTVSDVAGGTKSLLAIVTDVPRIATIVVGGILITAGVFALAGQHNITLTKP